MVQARKYVVKSRFRGLPKRDDFEIVKEELPPLQDGEIFVKTEWISVDPYLRGYSSKYTPPYNQFGFQVGLVQESKNPRFPVGTKVISHKGWCDYCIITNDEINNPSEMTYKLPNLGNLSTSLGIGVVGMPGATAYFGFLEVCQPKTGETVVVTGAAGAVGSIVGQIAKIKGCTVIGFAGSDDKVKWLEEIGFNKAFNYKTTDITAALKEAAPNGVDIYFDNVGGEISSLVMDQMRDFGRVAICGSISSYNNEEKPKANIFQYSILAHQLRIEGFHALRWYDRWTEAFNNLFKWINSGVLKPTEHVTEGFENIADAFIGMLKGENYGKAVVKV